MLGTQSDLWGGFLPARDFSPANRRMSRPDSGTEVPRGLKSAPQGRVLSVVLALAFSIGMHAEIVDRIAATIGSEVIAESQVELQIRIAAFIDGMEPDYSPEHKRKVLDSLIDQVLIRREIEFTRFPKPEPDQVAPLLKQVKARFAGEDDWREGLNKSGIAEAQLEAQLTWQVTMLRFIEYRFQPSVQVTNSELRQEYRRQTAAWREKNKTEPPPMEQMQPELEKIVRQRLVDSAMDSWLGQVRTQNMILYREGYR